MNLSFPMKAVDASEREREKRDKLTEANEYERLAKKHRCAFYCSNRTTIAWPVVETRQLNHWNERSGLTPSISASTISLMSSSKVHCGRTRFRTIRKGREVNSLFASNRELAQLSQEFRAAIRPRRVAERGTVSRVLPNALQATHEVHRIDCERRGRVSRKVKDDERKD